MRKHWKKCMAVALSVAMMAGSLWLDGVIGGRGSEKKVYA